MPEEPLFSENSKYAGSSSILRDGLRGDIPIGEWFEIREVHGVALCLVPVLVELSC